MKKTTEKNMYAESEVSVGILVTPAICTMFAQNKDVTRSNCQNTTISG